MNLEVLKINKMEDTKKTLMCNIRRFKMILSVNGNKVKDIVKVFKNGDVVIFRYILSKEKLPGTEFKRMFKGLYYSYSLIAYKRDTYLNIMININDALVTFNQLTLKETEKEILPTKEEVYNWLLSKGPNGYGTVRVEAKDNGDEFDMNIFVAPNAPGEIYIAGDHCQEFDSIDELIILSIYK